MLVDHREYLLGLAQDDEQGRQLAAAIDQASESMVSRPNQSLAGAVAYAMFPLREDGPTARPLDPIVRDGIASDGRLSDEFTDIRGHGGRTSDHP